MGLLDIHTVPGGPLGVNTYVVGAEGGAECLLIDPGAEVYRVEKAVQGRKVTAVLLTHAHFDHMLYAQPWLDQGARLYVHADDAAALSDPSLNLSTMVNCRLVLPDADVLLAEGDVVREAGVELQVLHTPGHTPGGVCYLSGRDMFSGDTLFYKDCGRTDLAGGNGLVLRNSLARLMTLDEQIVVYPGHGMKTKIAWERGTRF